MQFLKHLFNFYINSSVHVALAVCCLSYITILEFDLSLNYSLLFFTFFATITGYNFVKYFGLAKFHHRSLATWLKYIQIFSLFSFIALGYYSFKLDLKTVYFLGGLGLITFLYAIPFLPKKILFSKGRNLRAISGLKIHVIAFVWAVVTVIIPIVDANVNLTNDVYISAFQRFIYVLVVMLPFEIRDMNFDSLKLSTIPQRIGIKNTKIIGVLLAIQIVLLEFFKDEFETNQIVILLIIISITIIMLLLSKVKQNKYYSAFWIEGIPMIWLGLSLV